MLVVGRRECYTHTELCLTLHCSDAYKHLNATFHTCSLNWQVWHLSETPYHKFSLSLIHTKRRHSLQYKEDKRVQQWKTQHGFTGGQTWLSHICTTTVWVVQRFFPCLFYFFWRGGFCWHCLECLEILCIWWRESRSMKSVRKKQFMFDRVQDGGGWH